VPVNLPFCAGLLTNDDPFSLNLPAGRISTGVRVTATVITRSREVVTKGVVDQFGPVLQLQNALRSSVRPVVDVADARARIASRRPGFDPVRILSRARTVVSAFDRCIDALEVAGLASSTSVHAVRRENYDARTLALAWATGESAPSAPAQRLAQKAAAVVAGAILQSNARVVTNRLSLEHWQRPVCPSCGGAPDLAFVDGAKRRLVCSRCDTNWPVNSRGCIGCDATGSPTIARVKSPYLGYDLVICHPCGRYLKERAGRAPHAPLVERALTAEMDAAAVRRGLRI
jgi:formate dehydrogenase maturation protein FdhE